MAAVTTNLNDYIMPARPAAKGSGLLGRFWTALHDARMRRAEREIAFFIERQGGRMTDDLERQIERRFI